MKVLLAKPRCFCAGVERAIRSVECALELYGPPVYVLKDIVHNKTVVEGLRAKGAVFVPALDDAPEGAHLLFSAHGVAPEIWDYARARNLHVIDATCPLVEKVHKEALRFATRDYTILLIGESGHDEVVGTAGWAPNHIQIVLTEEDVEKVEVRDASKVAFLTQTTLSVDDCERVVAAIKRRFPNVEGPTADDICYATRNRQRAVNELVPHADLVLVVGDPESANSRRLANICLQKGKKSYLIRSASMIDDTWLEGVETLVVTSGASVPEMLVQGVVDYLKERTVCEVEEIEVVRENIHFRLPRPLDDFQEI